MIALGNTDAAVHTNIFQIKEAVDIASSSNATDIKNKFISVHKLWEIAEKSNLSSHDRAIQMSKARC